MPRFTDVAALTNFLHRLDEEYDVYAQALWDIGIRRSEQLANLPLEQYQAAGVIPSHGPDIKARSGVIQAQVACQPSLSSLLNAVHAGFCQADNRKHATVGRHKGMGARSVLLPPHAHACCA